MRPVFWWLQNVDLFRALGEAEAERLGAGSRERGVAAGSFLEAAADAASLPLALVREGELRVLSRDEEGEEPIGILGPGDLLGGAGDGEPADPALADRLEAISAARLLVFDEPARFDRNLEGFPGLGPAATRLSLRGIERESRPLPLLLRRRARARVAARLLELLPAGGRVRTGTGSRTAALLAMGPDVLAWEIERLVEAGAIRTGMLGTEILDRAKLEAIADEILPPPPAPGSPPGTP